MREMAERSRVFRRPWRFFFSTTASKRQPDAVAPGEPCFFEAPGSSIGQFVESGIVISSRGGSTDWPPRIKKSSAMIDPSWGAISLVDARTGRRR